MVICPFCEQGELYKVKIPIVREEAYYLCDECESLWLSEALIKTYPPYNNQFNSIPNILKENCINRKDVKFIFLDENDNEMPPYWLRWYSARKRIHSGMDGYKLYENGDLEFTYKGKKFLHEKYRKNMAIIREQFPDLPITPLPKGNTKN